MKLLTQEGAIAGTRSEDLTNKFFSTLHWFIKSGGVRTREYDLKSFIKKDREWVDARSTPQHDGYTYIRKWAQAPLYQYMTTLVQGWLVRSYGTGTGTNGTGTRDPL